MIAEIPNPLALIQQFALDGHEAQEILFCTFNQNLGFYERLIHAPCRAAGAAITILADVDVADHDIVAIQNAGRGYTAINVRTQKTFHPKLIAIAGRDVSLVAIGSGNLTDAGWWGNDELWTVHRASPEGSSSVFPVIADWCRRLPTHITVPTIGANALQRIADLLDRHQASDSAVRAVHTLDHSIIDQLPHGPVEQLNLYAPFHDAQTGAARQLIEQFQPGHIRLAFQPGLTSADGQTFAQLSRDYPIELIELSVDRYRHGKLVEWQTAGQWWALTGSANLSTAALCKATSHGGNVELAVIAPATGSLLPAGLGSKPDMAAKLTRTPRIEGRRQVALLLAATLGPDGVDIEFTRPLTIGAEIRFATPDELPDTWIIGPTVTPGRREFTMQALPSGSRIQLQLADGRVSNIVFTIDPIEATRRPRFRGAGSTRPVPELEDVFNDPTAARILLEMVAAIPAGPTAGAPRVNVADGHHTDHDYSSKDWRDYLDTAEAALSPSVLSFILGLPLTTTTPTSTGTRRDWDDDGNVPTGEEDLENERPGETDEEEAHEPETRSAAALKIAIGAKTRDRWWRTLSQHRPEQTLGLILKLRATLLFIAAGGRGYLADDWVPEVHRSITSLAEASTPPELLPKAASIAALAISVTRGTLSPHIETIAHAQQRNIEAKARPLLSNANADDVENYAEGLGNFFGGDCHVTNVLELAELIATSDTFAQAVAAIAEIGWICTIEGTHIHIAPASPNATGVVLTALSRLSGVHLASISCNDTGKRDSPVVACWVAPRLLLVQPTPKGGRWGAVYDLKGVGLSALVAGTLSEVSRREIELFVHGEQPGPIASDLLQQCGHE